MARAKARAREREREVYDYVGRRPKMIVMTIEGFAK